MRGVLIRLRITLFWGPNSTARAPWAAVTAQRLALNTAHFKERIQDRHRELFSSTVVKKRTAPV